MGKENQKTLDVAVEFGKLSFGKTKVSLGIKIAASSISDAQAKHFFIDSTLDARCIADPNHTSDDVPGQETMGDSPEVLLHCSAPSYRRSASYVTVSLSMPREDFEDPDILGVGCSLSERHGRIVAVRLSDKKEDSGDGK